MQKQRFLETKKHGTPRFPIECFFTQPQNNHWMVQLHWHKNVEILHMQSGTARITVGTDTFCAVPNDIFIINQEELHRIVSDDPALSYGTFIFPLQTLSFAAGDDAQAYLEPLIHNTMLFPTHITAASRNTVLGNILYQILCCTEQKEIGYELTVKVYLLQFISELIRRRQLIAVHSPNQKSERLKKILDYIQSYSATPLTIHTMAKVFHMSDKYFSRYFRTATGQTFTAYLNTVRTEKACDLLRGTDQTVLEIAFACGYENVSYFNRVFRSQTGQTPLQYRLSSDYISESKGIL